MYEETDGGEYRRQGSIRAGYATGTGSGILSSYILSKVSEYHSYADNYSIFMNLTASTTIGVVIGCVTAVLLYKSRVFEKLARRKRLKEKRKAKKKKGF